MSVQQKYFFNFEDAGGPERLANYFNKKIAHFSLVNSAYRLISLWNEFLKGHSDFNLKNQEMFLAYEEIITKAKFIALPRLSEEEIIKLFKEHFVESFVLEDYNLEQNLEAKLIAIIVYDNRNVLKEKIMESLAQNQQTITSKELLFDGKPVKGTIANWIKDYQNHLGFNRVEAVKRSEYLFSSDSAKSLSAEERKKLETLFGFFERLKISSNDLEGIEETPIFREQDGSLRIFNHGRYGKVVFGESQQEEVVPETVSAPDKIAQQRQSLMNAYKSKLSQEEIMAVGKEEQKIRLEAGADFMKLSRSLVVSLDSESLNRSKVIAYLKILSGTGQLADLLTDKYFNTIVHSRLVGSDKDNFQDNARSLSVLLQYILKEKMNLEDDEAGKLGGRLINLLVKSIKDGKYLETVYYDMKEKVFKWK